jgi:hypothetical protein
VITPVVTPRRVPRRLLAAAAVLTAAAAVLAGCTVGEGSGEAYGQLFVNSCSPSGGDYGEAMVRADYTLHPDFFAGEPIEDIRKNGGENRIVIRVETFPKRVRRRPGVPPGGPFKDQLIFDIRSLQVAMCVRSAALMTPNPALASFCDISAGDGIPRIRVGPEQPIRVAFAPHATCPGNIYVVATAKGDDPVVAGVAMPLAPAQWPSWIKLESFGSAASAAIDEGTNFKVEFGERLHAVDFQLDLEDDRVLQAPDLHDPVPASEINGNLKGYFDFDLERGQGAQTFP